MISKLVIIPNAISVRQQEISSLVQDPIIIYSDDRNVSINFILMIHAVEVRIESIRQMMFNITQTESVGYRGIGISPQEG